MKTNGQLYLMKIRSKLKIMYALDRKRSVGAGKKLNVKLNVLLKGEMCGTCSVIPPLNLTES